MRILFKSSFLWQFAGGFALGAVGLVAMQPADARHTLVERLTPSIHVQR